MKRFRLNEEQTALALENSYGSAAKAVKYVLDKKSNTSDNIYKSDINKGYVLPVVHSIYNLENELIGSFVAFVDWSRIINETLEDELADL